MILNDLEWLANLFRSGSGGTCLRPKVNLRC